MPDLSKVSFKLGECEVRLGLPPRPVRPVPQGYETGGEVKAPARRYWEKDMPDLSKVSYILG